MKEFLFKDVLDKLKKENTYTFNNECKIVNSGKLAKDMLLEYSNILKERYRLQYVYELLEIITNSIIDSMVHGKIITKRIHPNKLPYTELVPDNFYIKEIEECLNKNGFKLEIDDDHGVGELTYRVYWTLPDGEK